MDKTFYTIKDGRIDRIQTGEKPVGKAEWHEAPEDWGGAHGDKTEWFDKTMRRIPDNELVAQGVRKNNMGRVYNINDKSTRIIHKLDEELNENETKTPPLENEPHQKFDRKTNAWVVDEEEKELAAERNAVAQIQAQIEESEKKMLSLIIAKNMGRATAEELAKLDEYDALIEAELKPELSRKKSSLDTKLQLKKTA